MTQIVYEIAPIDFGWERLKSVEQTLLEMFDDETCESDIGRFAKDWHKAKELAKKKGWDGDFRQQPAVFWMPWHELEMVYGFVFKQENNGITYVVSPVKLPWLDT